MKLLRAKWATHHLAKGKTHKFHTIVLLLGTKLLIPKSYLLLIRLLQLILILQEAKLQAIRLLP